MIPVTIQMESAQAPAAFLDLAPRQLDREAAPPA
jgi:hypothetical protein